MPGKTQYETLLEGVDQEPQVPVQDNPPATPAAAVQPTVPQPDPAATPLTPEGTVADPAAQGTTPEPVPTPSADPVVPIVEPNASQKSNEEAQRTISDLSERLKRAEESLNAFTKGSTQQPQPAQPAYQPVNLDDLEIKADPVTDPKGYAKEVIQKANEISQANYQRDQFMVMARNKFYDDNKDLLGKEEIVKIVAQKVAAEMPNGTVEQVFNEVAKRTRTMIGAPGKPATTTPPSATPTTPPATPSAPPPKLSSPKPTGRSLQPAPSPSTVEPADPQAAYLESLRKERNRGMGTSK